MNPLALWKAATLLQRIGVSIALLIALFGLWKLFWWQYDSGVIREHEADVTQAVSIATQAGAEAASSASASTSATIEAGNEAARKAAAGSDDRLKAGLDALE